jgi:hypothetical protein
VRQIETPKEAEWIKNLDPRVVPFVCGENGHGEPIVDVSAMADAYDAIVAERDAAVRDTQVVREIRARRNVVVEVSPELLKNGAFTDQPLQIMLTENGDGTHLLTFRVSDTIRVLRQQLDASRLFSDEAVRAHTECYRRLRKAWVRLAACERVVEAARAVVLDAWKQHGYDQYNVGTATIAALRAAVAAETLGETV